jgi:hypothetical protein
MTTTATNKTNEQKHQQTLEYKEIFFQTSQLNG